jgi:hypothetical protein
MSKFTGILSEEKGTVIFTTDPVPVQNIPSKRFQISHDEINFAKALMTAGPTKKWTFFVEVWHQWPDPVQYLGFDGIGRILQNPKGDMPPAATSANAHPYKSLKGEESTSPAGPATGAGAQPAVATTTTTPTTNPTTGSTSTGTQTAQ